MFFIIHGLALHAKSIDLPINKKITTNLLIPSATISGTAIVCQNATGILITFTGSGGTAPYTFTYNINGGSSQTITTTGTNTTSTLVVNTSNIGTFTYNLISIHDDTIPITEQISSGVETVTINLQPNADLNSSAQSDIFNGFPVFKICSNQNTLIDFFNTSTTTLSNLNYSINWGDGSSDFTSTNNWTKTSHNYAVGIWTMLYTINGQNGCAITKTYQVFIGNNPAVGLGNPGNTDICISSSLTFPITGTENNPPGTTYTVTYNDGSPPTYLNHPPPSSVTHLFLKSSCGTNSNAGPTTYQNSFYASIVAINPCDQSSASVVPIRISTPPVSNFTIPQTVKCTNSQICLTNTSTGGDTASSASCSPPKVIWTISPNSGYTIANGTLGNDFDSANTNSWTSGSSSICPVFAIPGTYTITLKEGNHCDTNKISKTICIEPPLAPTFTLNNNLGCTPQAITATNTTATTNSCSPPTYIWKVVHTPAYCGTTIGLIPNQTTLNATYNFIEPGTYTITLTATNSCGSFSTSQTVTVKKPPTISSINGIAANYCGATNISPTAIVNGCAPVSSALTYAWNFPGGIPTTSNLTNPGPISYSTAGTYTASLVVSNECGASAMVFKSFTINDTPLLTNTPLSQTICSGTPTTLVNLTSNPAGATFTWTATATAGITGFLSSGTSTIPVRTISTTNASSGTVTYKITPSLNGCPGAVTNYVITVNPAPAITSQPVSSTVCLGGTPAVLSFTTSGVIGTPTYQWYSNIANNTNTGTAIPDETNATYTPPAATAGTVYYYCIISLPSGGCSNIKTNTATVTIMPNATISTQPTPTQYLCVGVTIAAPLSISYSGGTGTVSYQWYSNTSNSNLGGTPISGAVVANYTPPVYTIPRNYYYYATVSLNGNGCLPATSDVAEIIVYADPTISSQPIASQTLCQSATPLNLDVTATGGNGTFSYQWYSNSTNANTGGILIAGATSNSYTPLTNTVGTKYYYCIVRQNSTSGCSVTSTTAAIIVISSPTITQPTSSAVCQGGSPTLLSITVNGATGTPTYQWYSNTSNLNTGGTLIPTATNNTYMPSATTVGTIYYFCIVTLPSGGCSSINSNTATVTINAGATIDTQPALTQSLCVGGSIPSPLSVSYSGGTGTASYQWYSNTSNLNTGGTLIPSANSASYTPAAFATSGTYYYYVTLSFSRNGCGPISSNPAEIVVVSDPIVDSQPLVSQTLCQGAAPTNLTVSASGGIGTYSYQWFSSVSNANTGGLLITGETNATFTPSTTNVGKTYYYCVITQTGIGCNVTSTTSEVTVNLAPTIVSKPQSSTVCLGQIPILLSVTYKNGTGTPQYQWYSNTTNSISGGTAISGETNATFNPPNSAIGISYYYCVITFSSGGCSVLTSATATVVINPKPLISNKNTTICSGNTFIISPDNLSGDTVPTGTTYTWTNPSISPAGVITGASAQLTPQTSISQTLFNSTANPATATYTITPKSGTCTGTTFTIVVLVNPGITPNLVTKNSTCFGLNNGSFQTNITGGIPFTTAPTYQVLWTGPNGYSSTATNISNLAPGNYTLSITDNGGCPFTNTYSITEPDELVIQTNLKKDISCFNAANGSIAITATGGTANLTYTWIKNGLPYATTKDISNLSKGDYTISVSDANNCTPKTASYTIVEPAVLDAFLVNKTNVICFGDATGSISINATGGRLPYTFAWTGSNGFSSSNQNLTNIYAGNYNLVVTDNSGCTKNLSVQITQNTEILITAQTTPVICYGDNDATIRINVSGGTAPYQIQWNNLGTGTYQDNLAPGDYTVTVTDALNCIKTKTINIPDVPVFNVNPVVKNISCYGSKNGSINLNLVGGIAPVKLVWSDGSTAGTVRNNLGPGTYTATITDSKPCTISRTFIIIEPQALSLSANVTHAFDCTMSNSGAIQLIVSGGTLPYTYIWSNGATTKDLANIGSGDYLVTVTDANNCSKQAQFSVNRPAPLVATVVTNTVFDCETKFVNQNFLAQVSGGVPPYSLVWSSGTTSGTNNEIMNTNQNGTVILYATDAIGCKTNYTFNVLIPKLGTPSFTTSSYSYLTFETYSINDPIQFTNTATENFISINWDFGDGSFSTELNPIHTYVNPKDYVVTQTVTYPFGCVYIQKTTLIIGIGYVLVVPNAFTPNNDSFNDTFRPVTKGLKNIRLDVYDTWGSMIYSESGAVLRGWDGKIKGYNAENGNYYCKVSGETFYGTIVNVNHPFVLIK